MIDTRWRILKKRSKHIFVIKQKQTIFRVVKCLDVSRLKFYDLNRKERKTFLWCWVVCVLQQIFVQSIILYSSIIIITIIIRTTTLQKSYTLTTTMHTPTYLRQWRATDNVTPMRRCDAVTHPLFQDRATVTKGLEFKNTNSRSTLYWETDLRICVRRILIDLPLMNSWTTTCNYLMFRSC